MNGGRRRVRDDQPFGYGREDRAEPSAMPRGGCRGAPPGLRDEAAGSEAHGSTALNCSQQPSAAVARRISRATFEDLELVHVEQCGG
ncbi:hypothetical protein DEI92_10725 [Curtobacterium sp. MCBD17_034]|nr:hypothetical protein DEI92_10725 [Curtobacterium sp. MCBD17_034]PZM34523.1 hypothetical protein DEI90_07295 [Curtobacterium sp. MCBD17_031]